MASRSMTRSDGTARDRWTLSIECSSIDRVAVAVAGGGSARPRLDANDDDDDDDDGDDGGDGDEGDEDDEDDADGACALRAVGTTTGRRVGVVEGGTRSISHEVRRRFERIARRS